MSATPAWSRVKALFLAALDLPESERAHWVAEQCAGELSPALADPAQHRVTLQAGAVEAHGAQGPAVGGGAAGHVDAGCRRIEQEHREAVAAGRCGIASSTTPVAASPYVSSRSTRTSRHPESPAW